MPHGDFSDISALTLFAGSMQMYFYPEASFTAYGPVQPMFSAASRTPEMAALMNMTAGLLMVISFMLFTVRWNTVNGKLSGLGGIIAGASIVNNTFRHLDAGVFVLRPMYIYAGVLVLGGLHLMFRSNPVIKEKAK